MTSPGPDRFGEDVAFLRRHVDTLVLGEPGAPRLAVVPAYQARVMTSTTGGGESFGFVNRPVVEGGFGRPHIHPFGGEDRFWLGPEGGPFGLFFAPGAPFDLEHWQTPPPIDSEPWEIVARDARSASFRHEFSVRNRAGTIFHVRVDRTIRLLDREEIERVFSVALPPGLGAVGFETENRVTNVGSDAWRPETGLLSIWILGMFPPGDRAVVVAPIRPGPEAELGPRVRDDYFGKVPAERLLSRDDAVLFRVDGRLRSKIGVAPPRARDVLGSLDPDAGVLTLVRFTLPAGATRYVNSLWREQDDPYEGDVVNSYNDGPPAPGKPPLGPFYELETSSPALALAPGHSAVHTQTTVHLTGPIGALDPIARTVLGVSAHEIARAFDEGRRSESGE